MHMMTLRRLGWFFIVKMIIISQKPIRSGSPVVSDEPFNAVVCRSGPCGGTAGQLLHRLRAAVGRCPHGVLISTSCMLRAARCRRGQDHESGAYLLVQPCSLDRRPLGIAIRVGPVLTDADAAAVADWLAGPSLDVTRLEPRLRMPAWHAR